MGLVHCDPCNVGSFGLHCKVRACCPGLRSVPFIQRQCQGSSSHLQGRCLSVLCQSGVVCPCDLLVHVSHQSGRCLRFRCGVGAIICRMVEAESQTLSISAISLQMPQELSWYSVCALSASDSTVFNLPHLVWKYTIVSTIQRNVITSLGIALLLQGPCLSVCAILQNYLY